jgi:REP-associated tyrosine transposase
MDYHRRLPHWHPQEKSIFLTWHLHGSVPRRYPPPGSMSAGQAFVWMDRFLDETRAGPFWLRNESIAALVVDAIRFGSHPLGHYETLAYVVMPNHVHLLVTPWQPVPKITKRLKGYTAREANRILSRTGEAFWQRESYDHWVRNAEELARIIRYIENNPVRAAIARTPEEYRWSSAAVRDP